MILFQPTRGELYGIVGRTEGEVALAAPVAPQSPYADLIPAASDGLRVPETPGGPLEADLTGAAFRVAKAWGIPYRRLAEGRLWGCLVFYREGLPLPPAFLVMAEERALAGDWGGVACPAALARPIPEPNARAYTLTHARLRRLMAVCGYTGPLVVWMRCDRHPSFAGFDLTFGGPAVHAALGLRRGELREWLEYVYGGKGVPPVYAEGVAAAVRVSAPPWPLLPAASGARVDYPDEPWCWPIDLNGDGKSLWTAGLSGAVADVVGTGESPAEATREALQRARFVRVPDAQVRADALEWAPTLLRQLQRKGYVK